jgi:hypothetical protein
MKTSQAVPLTQADILEVVSTTQPLELKEIIAKVRKTTGRGEKAVRDAFNKTAHLLRTEIVKRPYTKPLILYRKPVAAEIVSDRGNAAMIPRHDQELR